MKIFKMSANAVDILLYPVQDIRMGEKCPNPGGMSWGNVLGSIAEEMFGVNVVHTISEKLSYG